ncbi:MAG TPA: 30S ribosomal protein S20 [Candidatus Paceibacterota bacterium]|jgi:small subunit ribosomal protein S20|nr:30S ribosomal protein S20 [Candidatus Paceibacterota bacterium]
MPITRSAKKALRNSANKQEHNLARKGALKSALKKMRKLVVEKKADEAKKFLPEVQRVIDKAAKTGVIKKNNAARKKSRIVAALKKASA